MCFAEEPSQLTHTHQCILYYVYVYIYIYQSIRIISYDNVWENSSFEDDTMGKPWNFMAFPCLSYRFVYFSLQVRKNSTTRHMLTQDQNIRICSVQHILS